MVEERAGLKVNKVAVFGAISRFGDLDVTRNRMLGSFSTTNRLAGATYAMLENLTEFYAVEQQILECKPHLATLEVTFNYTRGTQHVQYTASGSMSEENTLVGIFRRRSSRCKCTDEPMPSGW